ncbi:MAG: LPS-assembly protein LptD [Parvibaculaceae bacterium]
MARTPLSVVYGAGLVLSLLALSALPSAPALAAEQTASETGDVLMQADELVYDQNTKIVTATGNVEVAYGDRIMKADRMTYNETTGVVKAIGNVVLLEPTGDVLFADEAELSDELRDGVVHTLQVLLADKSRLAGAEAQRRGGNVTTVYKGVYSPCEVCKEEGQTTPLWQIKAFRVVHNQEEQRIIYEDAFFELFGVPILYTPFFSHPDPTVDRQSGFLAPSVGTSSDLGTFFTIPYYWVIAENIDTTLKPTFTSKEGILYEVEYRHRLQSGGVEFDAAAIWPKDEIAGTPAEENFRGSLFSNGAFDLNDTWSWGFSTELTTDDTFMRRFNISDETDLTTTAYLSGIDNDNEFTAEAFYFQGLLSTDNPRTTPVVAPLINYHYEYPEQLLGGSGSVDINSMVLNRNLGADSRRFSLNLGWDSQTITSTGEVYSLFVDLRGDVYHTDNVILDNGNVSDPTTVARALPTVGMEWRWPLIRSSGTTRQIIEPIVQLIYAPNTGSRDEIPDEDSLSFEFDTTNLYDVSRFAGLDRWEGGSRANVGFRASIYGQEGGSASLQLGQTYRLRENHTFDVASGLRDQESDFVGRISLTPSANFSLDHRFRLDKDDLTFRRNEVDAAATIGRVSAGLGYAFFDQSLSAALGEREEVTAYGTYRFTDYWRIYGSTRRDIEGRQTLQNNIGIGYADECLSASLAFNQNFTRDRDIEPENSLMFTINLKHLGGTQFTSALGGAE